MSMVPWWWWWCLTDLAFSVGEYACRWNRHTIEVEPDGASRIIPNWFISKYVVKSVRSLMYQMLSLLMVLRLCVYHTMYNAMIRKIHQNSSTQRVTSGQYPPRIWQHHVSIFQVLWCTSYVYVRQRVKLKKNSLFLRQWYYRWYWSSVTSPVALSNIFPGVCENLSLFTRWIVKYCLSLSCALWFTLWYPHDIN